MGGACSSDGGGERHVLGFGGEVGCGVTDWIELAHDRDRWRALVNEVMNLRVP
jgi:hypothetical protein